MIIAFPILILHTLFSPLEQQLIDYLHQIINLLHADGKSVGHGSRLLAVTMSTRYIPTVKISGESDAAAFTTDFGK